MSSLLECLGAVGKVNSIQQLTVIECLLAGQLSAGPRGENDAQDKGSDPEALRSSQRMRRASPPQLSQSSSCHAQAWLSRSWVTHL